MLSNFIDSFRKFFATSSPLELGLLVVAVVAVGIVLRVRAVRAAAKRRAAETPPAGAPEVTLTPTVHQWLARENAVHNDLPPLREPLVEAAGAPAAVPPSAAAPTGGQPAPPPGAAVATYAPPPAFETRPVDEAIVFPTGRGFGDYRTVDLPPPRNGLADLPEAGAIASILSEGLDDLASGGDRLAEAVRERPVQYFVGALAAGFVAGLLFPMIYGQQRVSRLLERLIESNEELKGVRLDERREARAELERRRAGSER